jgi:hypothetical protein
MSMVWVRSPSGYDITHALLAATVLSITTAITLASISTRITSWSEKLGSG